MSRSAPLPAAAAAATGPPRPRPRCVHQRVVGWFWRRRSLLCHRSGRDDAGHDLGVRLQLGVVQHFGVRAVGDAEAQVDRLQLLVDVEPRAAARLDGGSGANSASIVVACVAATSRSAGRAAAGCAARAGLRWPPRSRASAALAAGRRVRRRRAPPPGRRVRRPAPCAARMRSWNAARSSGVIAAIRSSIALLALFRRHVGEAAATATAAAAVRRRRRWRLRRTRLPPPGAPLRGRSPAAQPGAAAGAPACPLAAPALPCAAAAAVPPADAPPRARRCAPPGPPPFRRRRRGRSRVRAPAARAGCSASKMSLVGRKRSAAFGTRSTLSRRAISMFTFAVMPGFSFSSRVRHVDDAWSR